MQKHHLPRKHMVNRRLIRISLDNETLEPTSQESKSEFNEVVNVVPSAKSQQAALVAKPHRPTPLPISQQRYRRRQVPTELLQAESEMKEAFSWVKNVVSRNDEKEDECDLYGRMLAKKLRKIPEFQREYLMHDINEMVLRAMHPAHGSVATPSCSNGPPSNSSLISLSYSRPTSANSNNCSYASSQGINEHAQDQMEEHIQKSDTYQPSTVYDLWRKNRHQLENYSFQHVDVNIL
ncbi:unnamed protein product [Acanthoscelides obtectus]|uniref:BESS domain-containing protein n=1 Tax=Acanthoscelides obtectus TaxID=200917 RepID=A0A9P0JWU2_ACAOB|nr:unnamed protein product [Acanthoscelides obtectus]CAK1657116.1 hypothetical protein AOBTE_LOCUS20129 [Acanthoscelides obtectus]